jgi:hypothetical protein
MIRTTLCLLLALTLPASADQQVIYPPSAMPRVDNRDGTWKLPGAKLAGLPAGIYDVEVIAKNSIGLIRTDSTRNELTVAGSSGEGEPTK